MHPQDMVMARSPTSTSINPRGDILPDDIKDLTCHGQNLVYGPIKRDGHQSVNWLIGEYDIYDIYNIDIIWIQYIIT